MNYRNIITARQCRMQIIGRHMWAPLKSQSVNNYRYWKCVRRDKELAM